MSENIERDLDPIMLLRHVVLFKFKEGTPAEEIRSIQNGFMALPGQIPEIYDFEWGTDVSVEGKNKGFTHCFVVTFQDEAGRDTYLPHPEHEKFRGMLQPLLEDVLVVDYWTQG